MKKMKKIVATLIVSALSISTISAYATTASTKTSIYSIGEVLSIVAKNQTGEITKVDLETKDNKTIYYEVDVLENGKKTEIIVDAKTGKILKTYSELLDEDEKFIVNNYTQNSSLKDTTPAKQPAATTVPLLNKKQDLTTFIGEEKAKAIAIEKAGGGKIKKIKLDYDHGIAEYEIEVIFGDYEHEIDIDATTGKITSYGKDHKYD